MLTNSIKMQILLSRGNSILRNIFSERWAKYSGSNWAPASAKTFTFGIGKKVYDKYLKSYLQIKSIESGDLNEWDLTTLTDVLMLTDFPTDLRPKATKLLERSKLEELKRVRNKLAHAPTLGIENELFQIVWKDASQVLIFFGCLKKDLDKIKFCANFRIFEDENTIAIGQVNKVNRSEDEPTAPLVNVEDPLEETKDWSKFGVKNANLNQQLDADTELEEKLENIGITKKVVNDKVRSVNLKKPVEKNNKKRQNAEASNNVVDSILTKISRQFDPHVLNDYVKSGSETAIKIQTAISHFELFWDLCHSQRSDLRKVSTKIIHELSECFRIESNVLQHLTPGIQDLLCGLVNEALRLNQTSELDKDARVCFAYFMEDYKSALVFVQQSKRKYPNEKAFHVVHSHLCGYLGTHYLGFCTIEESLELFPNDPELLFYKASHGRLVQGQKYNMEAAVRAYKDFLAVAPRDHRWVPESHYAVANEYFDKYVRNVRPSNSKFDPMEIMEGVSRLEEHYRLGLQTEIQQLPFSLPYVSDQRKFLESNQHLIKTIKMKCGKISGGVKSTRSNVKGQEEPNESMLRNPDRIAAINSHRKHILECREILKDKKEIISPILTPTPPDHKRRAPIKLSGLKPITFHEMNTRVDKVYEGRVVQVTSVDDAAAGVDPFIQLVLEDENHNLLLAFIYNFPDTDENIVQQKLGFGARMSILNPYMRLAQDGQFGIRVDDASSLILHTAATTTTSCRFCMKERVDLRCANCKRAYYCSPVCQEMDWKLMKHKLICVPL